MTTKNILNVSIRFTITIKYRAFYVEKRPLVTREHRKKCWTKFDPVFNRFEFTPKPFQSVYQKTEYCVSASALKTIFLPILRHGIR